MKKLLLTAISCLFVVLAFAQVSENIDFTHEGYTIHGTLTKPKANGVFPLIVICPGSGANDRDGTLPMYGASIDCMYPNLVGDTLRTYKDLANGLTAKGYAVIRYDKIEYTYTNLGAITFKKLWLPFASAVDYAKTRNDIDVANIVLIGHSEGGMLIPYVARQRTDIKALINLAGARTPFDSLLAYQYREFPRKCGQDTTQTDGIAAQVLSYFAAIRSGNWNSATPAFAGVSAAVWAQYTKIGDSVLINYNLNAKPTLFIGLEKDNNVPVATEYERFKKEVKTPATFMKLPGLIHYMCSLNSPEASQSLIDTIAYWLQSKNITGIDPVLYDHQNIAVMYDLHAVTIRTEDDVLESAVVTDLTGRKIAVINGPEIILNKESFATGIYIITVKGNKQSYTTKVSL